MRISKYFIAFISAYLLCACDPISGIHRSAPVGEILEPGCIQSALEKVEGVSKVTYALEKGDRNIGISGLGEPSKIHRFSYIYVDHLANLYFEMNDDGTYVYNHDFMKIGNPPPREEIEFMRHLMPKIEIQIVKKCGLNVLLEKVEEFCSGVSCG